MSDNVIKVRNKEAGAPNGGIEKWRPFHVHIEPGTRVTSKTEWVYWVRRRESKVDEAS